MKSSPEANECQVAVASNSAIKIGAVERACSVIFPSSHVTVIGFEVSSHVAEQPEGKETVQGALQRMKELRQQSRGTSFDAYISLENGVFRTGNRYVDIASIVAENPRGRRRMVSSLPINLPRAYVFRAKTLGFAEHTIGSVIVEMDGFEGWVAKDPHVVLSEGRFSRESLLFEATERVLAGIFRLDKLANRVWYRRNKALIIGRFYGEEVETVTNASRAIEEAGMPIYPNKNTSAIFIPHVNSVGYSQEDGFFFLSPGKKQSKTPVEIQGDVFDQMQDLKRSGKICYVAIHNGYIGESTSIELAYAISIGVPIVLAETEITRFSEKVPATLRDIIERYIGRYPVVQVKNINRDSLRIAQRYARAVNVPELTKDERNAVINEACKLLQRLEFNYPEFYF